ncbi:MAG: hypothetical protein B5M55_07360 [Desulfococcus sp. 4484_242]|nr:MAG: hypothetical protein B5M55_07360 [Desulfococcus sp. 4484_242]
MLQVADVHPHLGFVEGAPHRDPHGDVPAPQNFPKSLKMMEKIHIKKILDENNWNISQTARELDIDRQTLYNKIEKYGIRKEEES